MRHGGVGQPDASRHRDPDGDGLAVRDPRLAGARGGRLHRRCTGGRGRYYERGGCRRDRRRHGRARRGRVVAAGAGPGAGVRAYGVYLQDAGLGDGAAGCRLSVDASWLDAAGADGGVACLGGSLVSARFVTPAGGVFGAGSVVDASGAVAPHVVVEPDVATPPAGETDGGEVPGNSAEKSPTDASPAAGEPTAGPTANPSLKPAATTTKTTTTATKTTIAKVPKPKAATVTTAALPKTGDNNWVVASVALFLLGTVLLAAAYRC